MFDLVGAIHKDIRLRNLCGITTTIDFLNTDITGINNDIGLLACAFSDIVGQVTAAIYCSQLIASIWICVVTHRRSSRTIIFRRSRHIASYGLVDRHRHITLR